MKIFLSFICSLLLNLSAHADSFSAYLAKKTLNVSHPKHLPYLLSHGHKTEKSVLLIHGIYSSPLYFKGIAQAYFEQGHNVVTILLPGHWEKDFYSMGQTTVEDWIAEADLGFEMALELGDKVILSGHSLGGLLATEQAQKRSSSEVEALITISPALDVNFATVMAGKAGSLLKLNGNTFTFSRPDGINVPDFNPHGAYLTDKLAKRVVQAKIEHPLFMCYSWRDKVLNISTLKKFYLNSPAAKKDWRTYSFFSGVHHDNIAQGPEDELTFPVKQHNPDFPEMMADITQFLHTL